MNRKTFFAGLAALAIGGAALAGTAAERLHRLDVRLPDGSIAHVRYAGDVPPQLVVQPAPVGIAFLPVDAGPAPVFAGFDPAPFAAMDRMVALMQARSHAMLRQVAALAQAPQGGLTAAAAQQLPSGTVSYSFVSSTNGETSCSRSVQMTSFGPGQAPKVVEQHAGDCGPAEAQRPVPAATPPARAVAPLVPVKLETARKAAIGTRA